MLRFALTIVIAYAVGADRVVVRSCSFLLVCCGRSRRGVLASMYVGYVLEADPCIYPRRGTGLLDSFSGMA